MIGGNSLRNYTLTGRIGQYPYGNSITGNVGSGNLAWPSGWESIKGHLGQRIIVP